MLQRNEKGQILVSDFSKLIKNTNGSEFNHRSGGWIKTITGLNKAQTNGFSLQGEFLNGPAWIAPGTLILDCSKAGSRNYPVTTYHLIKVGGDGTGILLQIEEIRRARDWAVRFWEKIEENLNQKENPLAGFSNDEILMEAQRRGLI